MNETANQTNQTPEENIIPEPVQNTVVPAAEQSQNVIKLNPETNYVMSMWNDNKLMASAFKMAQMLAGSSLIPQAYQGNPANCLIAIDIANRMNMPPMLVLQNLYIVQGKPAWSGQFCVAAINGCGKFTPLKYVFSGEPGHLSFGCTAQAERIQNGELCVSDTITMQMAQDEGWSTKSGSKWKTMPRQMMMYRSASFFARVYCPEVLIGLQTIEEVQDVHGYTDEKPTKTITLDKK
jgi:hypothetical protein